MIKQYPNTRIDQYMYLEAGFYAMIKRGNIKPGVTLAVAKVLNVEPEVMKEDSIYESKAVSSEGMLQNILHDTHEMKEIFDEQLKAKDRQIDNLQRILESVLGKSEGVTDEPLSLFAEVTLDMLKQYRTTVLEQVVGKEPAKKTNKHKSKVGGTQFSQDENALTVS